MGLAKYLKKYAPGIENMVKGKRLKTGTLPGGEEMFSSDRVKGLLGRGGAVDKTMDFAKEHPYGAVGAGAGLGAAGALGTHAAMDEDDEKVKLNELLSKLGH